MLKDIEVILNRVKINKGSGLTEADTIRTIVLPLLRVFGWDVEDINEVKSEYRHKPQDNPVDCALFIDGTPSLFVEAKALDVSLNDRKWTIQTLNYANAVGVKWCVLTNGSQWKFYKVHHAVDAEEKMFFSVHIDEHTTADDLLRDLHWIGKAVIQSNKIHEFRHRIFVDQKICGLLNNLSENSAFIRLMKKEISDPDVSLEDIRISLKNMKFTKETVEVLDNENTLQCEDDVCETSHSKRSLPRLSEMCAAGIVHVGQTLRIRGHPGSEATISDEKTVNYKGENLSLHTWGCKVKGWSSIQIYVHAETKKGDLLDDLRKQIVR